MMLLSSTALALVASTLIQTTSTTAKPLLSPRQSSLDSFVASEAKIALAGILKNIGSSGGSTAAGAKPGVVIASPSTSNPNYLYFWTRDAALTAKALVEHLVATGDTSLQSTLNDYVNSQAVIQRVNNPSGGFTSGGLGEPKFNIDETAFTGAWGRPQRDGPALRATALMAYANHLGKQSSFVTSTINPIISADLNYVVQYWNQTGFDLWEEVNGSSFFTIAAQHRSLVEGATYFGSSNYAQTAQRVLCFLASFWSPSQGYIVANVNQNNGRSGLDTNTILGSIHSYDPSDLTCSSITYQPCSDLALSNLRAVVASFRIYTLNNNLPSSSNGALALGRYPEDSYYGGNPWYLTTLAAAEQLYDALNTWSKAGSLRVTPTSLSFFKSIVPSAAVGTYASGSQQFTSIMNAVRAYADGFVAIVQQYTPSNGGLAEQYSRSNGQPLSAVDLTWSYASFLTVTAARNGVAPASWGSGSQLTCGGGSGGGGDGGGGNVGVTFNEIATTVYGESIFLVGSISQLGNWNTANAIACSAAQYTSSNNLWTTTVQLPAGTAVQYKFIRKKSNGSIVWASGSNRAFTTGAAGTTSTQSDTWS